MSLRVLCLHGYQQSATAFRSRTGPLRRLLKSTLTLTYIDAPHRAIDSHIATDSPIDSDSDGGGLAWWNRTGDVDKEVAQSLECISQALDKEAYDGILGFSQGAAMAAVAMAVLRPSAVKFVVLVSGFYPENIKVFNEAMVNEKIRVPALLVIGQTDRVVEPERGRMLAERAFTECSVAEHPGGHY
ncbi:hypothetical protein GGI21_004665, partial [Coemansia aciculifera]